MSSGVVPATRPFSSALRLSPSSMPSEGCHNTLIPKSVTRSQTLGSSALRKDIVLPEQAPPWSQSRLAISILDSIPARRINLCCDSRGLPAKIADQGLPHRIAVAALRIERGEESKSPISGSDRRARTTGRRNISRETAPNLGSPSTSPRVAGHTKPRASMPQSSLLRRGASVSGRSCLRRVHSRPRPFRHAERRSG